MAAPSDAGVEAVGGVMESAVASYARGMISVPRDVTVSSGVLERDERASSALISWVCGGVERVGEVRVIVGFSGI